MHVIPLLVTIILIAKWMVWHYNWLSSLMTCQMTYLYARQKRPKLIALFNNCCYLLWKLSQCVHFFVLGHFRLFKWICVCVCMYVTNREFETRFATLLGNVIITGNVILNKTINTWVHLKLLYAFAFLVLH